MTATEIQSDTKTSKCPRANGFFNNIKFFVLCHGMLQLAQLMVSGYLKGSISTIEKRYGLTSQKSGLLASFNEVGNTVLIVFVSYFGSRVHRPRCIGFGAMIASMAAFLIALPHFFSGPYEYTHDTNSTKATGLCKPVSVIQADSSNLTCTQNKSDVHHAVFPILLLGQLLLGIGGVPIQPFGISYIDDYADKKNSPFYLGILFALTVIGPALGYMMGSFLLRFFVDINTISPKNITLTREDARWVGAWWIGFLLAGTLLFLTSLPYLFFPRSMNVEETTDEPVESIPEQLLEEEETESFTTYQLSFIQFLKQFPHILLRTLRKPIYLLVVLAQVNLAAMVAGLATFMPKFIERQFMQTASFSNMMIGGLSIPSAMLGIMAGGMILRRLSLSVKASAAMCTAAVLMAIIFALPLLFLGCSTQKIGDHTKFDNCSFTCSCSEEAFNPVCVSDVEYRSPCHAGCKTAVFQTGTKKVLNYTNCSCADYAIPGPCKIGCSHLLIPFMVLSSLTCFLASLSQTPSFMMILRTVTPADKSLALGIQFMLFRVLAFLPAPVLYGTAIDSTCIVWGKKCNKNTSCHYYDLDLFRQRFLGLQTFFVFGAVVFFLLSFLVMKKLDSEKQKVEKMMSCVTGEKPKEDKDFKQLLLHSNEKCEKPSVVST